VDTGQDGEGDTDQRLRKTAPVRVKGEGEESNAPNHRNSNRPRRIANRETEIRVIGSLVLTLLHVVYDLCQTCQHVVREGLKLPQV
jgi:hypothetical protein